MTGRTGLLQAAMVVALLSVALVAAEPATPADAAQGCGLFPSSSFWYANVSNLPVHPRSDRWIGTMGESSNVHPDFGSGRWDGARIGIPITRVGNDQRRVRVGFYYPDESDRGRYPIPGNAKVEGGRQGTGDRHVLVLQRSRCRLFELFDARPRANDSGNWRGGSGAKYDLTSNALRPDGWTSADASGLPITPGLVRYSEVAAGEVDHVIRMTAPVTRRRHIWPARHDAGSSNSVGVPPMGAWLRLKEDIDPADFPPQASVIVEALQTHGAMIVDNGSAFYLSGAPHPRWDNDDLRTLRSLTGEDFEFVRSGRLRVDPDSMEVKRKYQG